MSYASKAGEAVPWWREPTKDQWYAFIAAWLGWTLDAFDFTVFLVIMVGGALCSGHPGSAGLTGRPNRIRLLPNTRGEERSHAEPP